MNLPKLDTLLNVSLQISAKEREKSSILNTGYEKMSDQWELIVYCTEAPEEFLKRNPQVLFYRLSGNYGIVYLPKKLILELAMQPEIIYMEVPRRLYMGQQMEISPVKSEGIPQAAVRLQKQLQTKLTGDGVLIGIADSGIDIFHPAFQNPDGSTRILGFWDQDGTVYEKAEIDEILQNGERFPADLSGHGTAVAGIAGGSLIQGRDFLTAGYAPKAEFLVVRLRQRGENEYAQTAGVMAAVEYLLKTAKRLEKPLVINLSLGSNYGSHSGDSILARYLNEASMTQKTAICVGMGNEAEKPIHTSASLKENHSYEISILAALRQPAFSMQLWKHDSDIVTMELLTPSGEILPVLYGAQMEHHNQNLLRYYSSETNLLVYNSPPSPYQPFQEIFFDFIPENDYVGSGNWRLRLTPRKVLDGTIECWMSGAASLNIGTGFAAPSAFHTLTIPSSAFRVISVGAADGNAYASFSGRGFTAFYQGVKPDLAAPGVQITAPGAQNRQMRGNVPYKMEGEAIYLPEASALYRAFSGTSFATPAAAGLCALLMEWGIVRGNDPWLYGERIKGWLHRFVRQIPAFIEYPNPYIGYGLI